MALSVPTQVATPFANSGLKNTIPQSATGSNLASLETGFPAVTMMSVGDGGTPPQGQDFNGILYQVTDQLRYAQAGGLYPYNSTFCTAIGGYPLGAILMSSDGKKIWLNGTANNRNNPDSNSANWAEVITDSALTTRLAGYLPLTGGNMSNSVTFTAGNVTLEAGLYYNRVRNVDLSHVFTAAKEDSLFQISRNPDDSTHNGSLGVLHVAQTSNTRNFDIGWRVGNPRGGNLPETGAISGETLTASTSNCWDKIGLRFYYDLNMAFPYANRTPPLRGGSEHFYSGSHLVTHSNLEHFLTRDGNTNYPLGAAIPSTTGDVIFRTVNTAWIRLNGGTSCQDGANLLLYGVNSSSNAGMFQIQSRSSSNSWQLKGSNAGLLSWNGTAQIDGQAKIRNDLVLTRASGEGGQLNLAASEANTAQAGIALDQYNSTLRIFGVPSADGSSKTGQGTPLVIDPYAKTITGGYAITGSLSGNASSATKATQDGSGAVITSTYLKLAGGKLTGDTEIDAKFLKVTCSLAGYHDPVHNGIFRGKHLGSSLTAAQSAAIQAGTFDDMYIGDYWTIGGVNYRIAAFDYYYMCGDGGDSGSITNQHHVVIVPDRPLYNAQMNETNIVTGAYVGSKMYTENLDQAKTTITSAFGVAHLLSVRQYFHNATNADYGFTTAGAWYDATVWLMNEINVYGCRIWGNYKIGNANANLYTTDNRQYPLFRFWPVNRQAGSRFGFWLRDPVSATACASVSHDGCANYYNASVAVGVRPAFCII